MNNVRRVFCDSKYHRFISNIIIMKFDRAIGKAYETSNDEHDWTPVKYLNVLYHNRIQKQLRHFFLKIFQKY